jgi:hypothetical protein
LRELPPKVDDNQALSQQRIEQVADGLIADLAERGVRVPPSMLREALAANLATESTATVVPVSATDFAAANPAATAVPRHANPFSDAIDKPTATHRDQGVLSDQHRATAVTGPGTDALIPSEAIQSNSPRSGTVSFPAMDPDAEQPTSRMGPAVPADDFGTDDEPLTDHELTSPTSSDSDSAISEALAAMAEAAPADDGDGELQAATARTALENEALISALMHETHGEVQPAATAASSSSSAIAAAVEDDSNADVEPLGQGAIDALLGGDGVSAAVAETEAPAGPLDQGEIDALLGGGGTGSAVATPAQPVQASKQPDQEATDGPADEQPAASSEPNVASEPDATTGTVADEDDPFVHDIAAMLQGTFGDLAQSDVKPDAPASITEDMRQRRRLAAESPPSAPAEQSASSRQPSTEVMTAMAAVPMDAAAMEQAVIRALGSPTVQRELFAILSSEALLKPSLLADATGLRRFLAAEVTRLVEDQMTAV